MPTRSLLGVLALSLALGGTLAACERLNPGPPVERMTTVTQRNPVAEVVVVADSGSVTVKSWFGSTVNVTRTEHYRGSKAPVLTNDLLAGGILRLQSNCSDIPNCSVEFVIQAPPEKAITVRLSSGFVDVADMTGRLDLRTASGAVRLARATGATRIDVSSGTLSGTDLGTATLEATVTSGPTDLSFAEAPDTVTVTASSGNIAIRLPDEAYNVTATSSSGAVSVDVRTDPSAPRTVVARTASGSIRITK